METNAVLVRAQAMPAGQESTIAVEETQPAALDLEVLYREHSGFVWRNARRFGCDDDLADDVVHEVFLVVARRVSEFRQDASVRTWLFAIAYRAVQRLKRDRARRGVRLQQYCAEQGPPGFVESHARLEAAEYLHLLLSQLDESKRVVFVLAEMEGMTSIEIGSVLGLKPPTIDSRLRAARKVIERLIARDTARQRRQRP
jgi:RNA polymerase sigma-70 factor (ECF subfamily)